MDRKEQLRQEIYRIEDNIRKAPRDTPNKVIFDWYTQIDGLRNELESMQEDTPETRADESNSTAHSNADTEALADESQRESFVSQWNEDSPRPETWSQIVGTAKEPS